MNKTLEQIILDWIGEDVTFSSKENNKYNAGYSLAIADLRARVPELEKKLEEYFEEREDDDYAMGVMDTIITRL